MKIAFDYLGIKENFQYSELARRVIRDIFKRERKQLGEISIILTDNQHILSINKSFLQHSYYTDVITFNNTRKNKLVGDIIISIDQVEANAKKYDASFAEEMMRVIIHGVLHLIGYDDVVQQDRAIMKEKEEEYLLPIKKILEQ
ncbi:MAG: rRNA maturation RNase YbeY [Bacteroidales bacterium]|nr:rRNA maturation RNase YbeY [Bacteroidales bacterium]